MTNGSTKASLTDKRRNNTKDKIVENASHLFATKGYNNASIAEIEQLSGLKAGSGGLYRHFTSKAEILLEVVNQYHVRIISVRNNLFGCYSGDLEADLKSILKTLINFMKSEHNMLAITGDTNGIPEDVRGAISDTWNEAYGIFIDLFLHYELDESASRLMSVMTLGAISHFVYQLANWHSTPLEIKFDEYVNFWASQTLRIIKMSPKT